ncbi:4-fold beta flower protein [Rhodococcus sp. (in: high G+C Gram-positive bacteria)]|uniref:4-fold beta flower protein n=1 Tax=Rhodococcus sp. TaxID=1831 RepID=UPI003BAFCB51
MPAISNPGRGALRAADLIPLISRDNSRSCITAGDQHIYDAQWNWVAYIVDGHAWSASTGRWCGPVDDTNSYDHSRGLVCWNPDFEPHGARLEMHRRRPSRRRWG